MVSCKNCNYGITDSSITECTKCGTKVVHPEFSSGVFNKICPFCKATMLKGNTVYDIDWIGLKNQRTPRKYEVVRYVCNSCGFKCDIIPKIEERQRLLGQ